MLLQSVLKCMAQEAYAALPIEVNGDYEKVKAHYPLYTQQGD